MAWGKRTANEIIMPEDATKWDKATDIANDVSRINSAAMTNGTATALIATIPNFTYKDMAVVNIKLHTTIGSEATLNINGLGAKPICAANGKYYLASTAITNSIVTLVYNESQGRFYSIGGSNIEALTSDSNTSIGIGALKNSDSDKGNTAIGFEASKSNTSGLCNVAIGQYALTQNTSGLGNCAMGAGTLYFNITGERNVAIGGDAQMNNYSGSENVAVGTASLYNSDGSRNVAIGVEAGFEKSDGQQLKYVTDSIYVGSRTSSGELTNGSATYNEIVIGADARGHGSCTAHIGNSLTNSISFGNGTQTAFTNRSDPRIKEDIKDANLGMCYDDIKSLPLHRFKYKDFVGNKSDTHLTGFLSTEFAKFLPKAIHKSTASFDALDEGGNVIYETKLADQEKVEYIEETDPKTGTIRRVPKKVTKQIEKQVAKQITIEDCESIDPSQLLPTLVGAVKMLMQKVEDLEDKLNDSM